MNKKEKGEEHFLESSKNDGLIFQFLLVEFFKMMHEVKTIEKQLKQLEKTQSVDFQEIIKPVAAFSGGMLSYTRFFPWGLEEGILGRFAYYTQLLTNFGKYNKELEPLQINLEKGEKEVVSSLECLKKAQKEKSRSFLEESLIKNLKATLRTLKKMVKYLPPLLSRFKNNEHVIYFLLRFQHTMGEIYGKSFLIQFLEKTFHGKLQYLEQFLVKEYSSRGFKKLSKNIKEKVAELAL